MTQPNDSPAPLVTRAVARDREAIRALLEHASSTFDVDAELSRPYARIWLARCAADDDAPGGVLLSWQVFDELEIIDLFVAPAARRRGLGRALMRALVRYAEEHALAVILLEVRRDNSAAQQLYFAFGFQVCGERAAYYADGEDALLLRLQLRQG